MLKVLLSSHGWMNERSIKSKKLLTNRQIISVNLRLTRFVDRSIKGRITDENKPLPGVSVVVKGTTTGMASDAQGRYALNVKEGAATLVFSFLGYVTNEVPIGSKAVIDVNSYRAAVVVLLAAPVDKLITSTQYKSFFSTFLCVTVHSVLE
jgi:hypothetical protein